MPGAQLVADKIEIHGQFLVVQLQNNFEQPLEQMLKATYTHSLDLEKT
jgi:hypothetical protein